MEARRKLTISFDVDTLSAADLIIVGSGFFGLTIAERAASELGLRVAIVERREHIGGNAWSEADPSTGIEIHRYGSHLFHCNSRKVWEYLNQFCQFSDYRHSVFTRYRDQIYAMPINLGTICQYFGRAFTPAEARALITEQASECAGRRTRQSRGQGNQFDRAAALRSLHSRLHDETVAG